jgi:ATP-dependent Clp protease protease subunit
MPPGLPPELQSALLGRRMVFVRGRLDDAAANSAIAQLLLIAHTAVGEAIDLYLDSPGGSVGAALSLYDVLRTLESAVSTTCIGTAGGASVLILAGGTGGRRFALPHARIHLMEDPITLDRANPGQVTSQAGEVARQHARWRAALVRHVAHSGTQLARDLAAGRWLSAAEARDYGLVDGMLPGAPRSA